MPVAVERVLTSYDEVKSLLAGYPPAVSEVKDGRERKTVIEIPTERILYRLITENTPEEVKQELARRGIFCVSGKVYYQ